MDTDTTAIFLKKSLRKLGNLEWTVYSVNKVMWT